MSEVLYKTRIWHDDHITYHYEWRTDVWNNGDMSIPYHRNEFLLGHILPKLNPRGWLYHFLQRFLEFEYTPDYGL